MVFFFSSKRGHTGCSRDWSSDVCSSDLHQREARFLALVAAAAPARGAILEIGSFKGKSTVGLASIAARYSLGRVIAVDPFTAPSSTDPSRGGSASSYGYFCCWLSRAGLTDYR